MRWSLVARVIVVVALVGCRSAEQEQREADERRVAREARHREIRSWHAAAPVVTSDAAVAHAFDWPSVLDAENAVTYCEEAWHAHVWEALDGKPGADVRTATLRLRKARRDLERVRAGEGNVPLETRGGFPLGSWVSGHYREDGIYVQGRPASSRHW